MKFALAVDIGGTFTDVVLMSDDGHSWTDKTLTTHHDLLEGFFRVADQATSAAGISYGEIDDVVVHATTVVTNVLIERKGEPAGLILTKGFKDILYLRDEHRYDMFDPQIEYPEPLITRDNTWALDERTYADGGVGREVDLLSINTIADEIKEKGIQSVAISFLNAYANPANEHAARKALNEVLPDVYITLSSDVAPQMREYPRTSTAAVNAYVMPLAGPYLQALTDELRTRGLANEPLIMLSSGGVVGAGVAREFPVRMIESGPAAGALAAGYVARKFGLENIISFDMGGTTAKACLIQDGEPLVVGEFEVDRQYLFKPGSGMPVSVPSIDMIEIGTGGGSIARVDELGLLKVGPDSAGSAPGPACYGNGGTDACVTDADVVLGILDPANFLGGDMPLKANLARDAIGRIAERLNVSLEAAAFGIFGIAGESMAAAARAHATDRGVNYRGLPLIAFGGAGPVHACYVAERLDSTQVYYPPMASVLSAFGTLVTPVRLDLVRSSLCRLCALNLKEVEPIIEGLLAEGNQALQDAGIAEDAVSFDFSADMRYFGQQNEVTVPLAGDPRQTADKFDLAARFGDRYEAIYGLRLSDMEVEVVSWRVTAHGGKVTRETAVALKDKNATPKSTRTVHLDTGALEVPVYDRTSLASEQEIDGPVIIEERETTVFVLPGWRLNVATDGTLIANNMNRQE